ncbi:MAG: hypothetical protein SO066_07605 [Proteus mirabilis]|nr:hypothetical protein [Proteus mirabilis]
MKKKSILIYGEYSGYGKSLTKGFIELGHNAEIFSFQGDGFKNIQSGITLQGKNNKERKRNILKLIPKFLKFKNIIIVNTEFVNKKNNGFLVTLLLKLTGKRIILLACGDDTPFIKYGKSGLIPNWPYDDISLPNKKYLTRIKDYILTYYTASIVHKIIPCMYDYSISWKQTCFKYKITETIPLACDGKLQPIKKTEDKIVIMHGINRIDFKGTKVIKSALSEIEKKYPNDVEIIYPEHLPLTEYLEIMKRVDIAIDQTKGNSYGMNAIYSMFSGHVVLAPANDLFLNDINLQDSPIVKINNTEESIVNSLSLLIEAKNELDDKKKASQDYAANIHSPIKIAEKIEHYLV